MADQAELALLKEMIKFCEERIAYLLHKQRALAHQEMANG